MEREVQLSAVPELTPERWEEMERSRRGLRALVWHLQQEREEEGRRLAHEVHDELGGLLARLKMDLALAPAARAEGPGGADGERRQQLELIDRGIAAVQRIAYALRPPELDDFGLVPAIESAIAALRRSTGIRVAESLDTGVPQVREAAASALFRILAEALRNVERHARATLVVVRLRVARGALRLMVADNGVGIADDRVCDPCSVGLAGMRERALARGGTLSIRTGSNGGTTVAVTLPLAGNVEGSP
jgi:two-component system sensor histidine kinase UhpB